MSKTLNKVIGGLFKVNRALITLSVLLSGKPSRILRRFLYAKPAHRAAGRAIRKLWR